MVYCLAEGGIRFAVMPLGGGLVIEGRGPEV